LYKALKDKMTKKNNFQLEYGAVVITVVGWFLLKYGIIINNDIAVFTGYLGFICIIIGPVLLFCFQLNKIFQKYL